MDTGPPNLSYLYKCRSKTRCVSFICTSKLGPGSPQHTLLRSGPLRPNKWLPLNCGARSCPGPESRLARGFAWPCRRRPRPVRFVATRENTTSVSRKGCRCKAPANRALLAHAPGARALPHTHHPLPTHRAIPVERRHCRPRADGAACRVVPLRCAVLAPKVDNLQVPPRPRFANEHSLQVGLSLLHAAAGRRQSPALGQAVDVRVDREGRVPFVCDIEWSKVWGGGGLWTWDGHQWSGGAPPPSLPLTMLVCTDMYPALCPAPTHMLLTPCPCAPKRLRNHHARRLVPHAGQRLQRLKRGWHLAAVEVQQHLRGGCMHGLKRACMV